MGDGIHIDFSELDALTADLGKAPGIVAANVAKALGVTAGLIKKDWQEPLKGSATVPAGAASITYDLKGSASMLLGKSSMSAEIGPELGRSQGPIVGMLEMGTPNTGPRGFGLAALKKNEADFVEGVTKAAGDVL